MTKFCFFLLSFLIIPFAELSAQEFNPDFFVFEDGLWNAQSKNGDYWADLIHDAGFDGMELIGLERVDELMPELKKRELKLFTLYIEVDLDSKNPYDAQLKDYISKWKGEVPYLWLHVHSKKHLPSDPAGDERCIQIVRELADFAKPSGLKLAFYPHADFWIEKVTDGIRLAEKINRENVGTVFNLCHYLKKDDPAKIEKRLEQAIPHLFLVSINGADDGDTNNMDWDRLIQPLGQGSFDVFHVLELLKEKGYRNPIGLQCYNIQGQPEKFLKYSVKTWKKYIRQIN
ncbi:sugar phosphate isomerase/epimerase family protein [Bacteroidota bacterium]